MSILRLTQNVRPINSNGQSPSSGEIDSLLEMMSKVRMLKLLT